MGTRRTITVIAVSLTLILAFGGCSQSPEAKKAKHMERGNTYFDQGKFNEAVIEYKNVIQTDPKDPVAHYKLAQSYLALGGLPNLQRGFAEMSKAVEFDPELYEAQIKLGELYLLAGDVKKAKEKAELALELEPESAEGQVLLGKTHAVGKDFDQGVAALQEALKLDPKRIQTYLDLATVYQFKKDSTAAQQTLHKALEVDPKSIPAHMAFGDFWAIQRHLPEAEAEYKQAIASQVGGKNTFVWGKINAQLDSKSGGTDIWVDYGEPAT